MAKLTAESLLTPPLGTGELEPASMWPKPKARFPLGYDETDVTDKLTGFLDDGYKQAAAVADPGDKNEAVLRWAYYRAYREVYKRLVQMPSSVAIEAEGSSGYTADQLERLKALMDEAKAAFDEIVVVVDDETPRSRQSANAISVVRW